MANERLELAFDWCKKNNLDLTRLKKFNRLNKKKRSKTKRRKLLTEKAKTVINKGFPRF